MLDTIGMHSDGSRYSDVCVQLKGWKGDAPEVVHGIMNLCCQYVNTEINREGFPVRKVVTNYGVLILFLG